MKFIYYGFGGFIGFVCGVVVSLIFFWLEKSGTPLLSNLVRDYGLIGRYIAELVNMLPYIGIVCGFLLVRILFKDELDRSTD
ncbi:MAG: hypothetical protein G3M78_13465 [Candidatus Nitrohelix vancouverensis]|uniref:Uncharacterized protein n=1 Tax=Candidatus Nitrohelix vancouverensis TaxID=2705534 RepID=A0A7T0G4F8_9BACT|nr:MAG: hypothetical protein G3M78_13465 [Candidatus Nitrohelix vancouverensis]